MYPAILLPKSFPIKIRNYSYFWHQSVHIKEIQKAHQHVIYASFNYLFTVHCSCLCFLGKSNHLSSNLIDKTEARNRPVQPNKNTEKSANETSLFLNDARGKTRFAGYPNCLYAPLYVWMTPYVWTLPCMFGCSHMFGHTLYVWMPPIHTQHEESMLCHTKGVSLCPHTFGCPPVCLDAPYVWTLPICLDAPICLNTLLYVWVMFGCPLYNIHNT